MAVVIEYSIPDNKISEFKLGFLTAKPVPLDSNGEPVMSDYDWIRKWGKEQFMRRYRQGKLQIAQQTAIIDEELIE